MALGYGEGCLLHVELCPTDTIFTDEAFIKEYPHSGRILESVCAAV